MPLSNTYNYSPPPSPPSPCSSWPVNSSSPASSPVIEPLSLDDAQEEFTCQEPQITVTDPLAASYNGRFVDAKRPISSAYRTSQKRPRLGRRPSFPEVTQAQVHILDPCCDEETLWENAIEKAFETGGREIELRGLNLKEIPARVIKDLSKMVILPQPSEASDSIKNDWPSSRSPKDIPRRRIFTRIQTAPASTFAASASLISQEKKTLSSELLLGTVRNPMTMYLGQNNIKELPAEMWTLQNLTVLSLRNNNISYLPPGIALLEKLQSLNVANNKLEYVPAELMDMKTLTSLILFPNPFVPDPRPLAETRSVSQTKYTGPRVPTLTELCLRALLSRPTYSWTSPSRSFRTVLEALYPLPLPSGHIWRPVSIPLSRTLAACVPGSIVVDGSHQADQRGQSAEPGEVTGISSCQNPSHRKAVYIHHSEERYSWEKVVAGIKIGGTAAVLWRGCQHGCLDFLGPPTDGEEGNLPEDARNTDTEEVMEEIIVHSIQFTGELDFDD